MLHQIPPPRLSNELYHYGIPKMQWGIRRYQNEDGTLTPEGRERYGYGKREKALKDEHSGQMYDYSEKNFIGPPEEHYSDVLERAMTTGEDVTDRIVREYGHLNGPWTKYENFKDGRDFARMAMDELLYDGFKKDENEMQREASKYGSLDGSWYHEQWKKYSDEANQYGHAKDFVSDRMHETYWNNSSSHTKDAEHARDLMRMELKLMGETSIDDIMKMYK